MVGVAAVLTIRINDLNDNKPLFILDTLRTSRSVIEEAAGGTLVGTIFARDIDGPEFNKIAYSIAYVCDAFGRTVVGRRFMDTLAPFAGRPPERRTDGSTSIGATAKCEWPPVRCWAAISPSSTI